MLECEEHCLYDGPQAVLQREGNHSVSSHSQSASPCLRSLLLALIIRHPVLLMFENGHLTKTHTVGHLCFSAATS